MTTIEITLDKEPQRKLSERCEDILQNLSKIPGHTLIGDPLQILEDIKEGVLWEKKSEEQLTVRRFSTDGRSYIYFPKANIAFRVHDEDDENTQKHEEILFESMRGWNRIAKSRFNKNGKISFLSCSISSSCNLGCDYCFNQKGTYGIWPAKNMKEEDARQIIRFVRGSNTCSNLVNINLFGGEPLLNPKAIEAMIDEAKTTAGQGHTKLYFSLVTNGTIAQKSVLDLVERHVAEVNLSIVPNEIGQNSTRPLVSGGGSYETILSSLDKWPKSLRERTSLAVTWRGDWLLEEFDHFCKERGFKKVMVSLVQGTNDADALGHNLLQAFEEYYEKTIGKFAEFDVRITTPIEEALNIHFGFPITRACGAGSNMAAVDIDGNMNGCYLFQHRPELVSGETRNFKLQNERLSDFRKWVDPQRGLPCKDCEALNICGGDCGYNREYRSDAFARCDYLKKYSELKVVLLDMCSQEDIEHVLKVCNTEIDSSFIF